MRNHTTITTFILLGLTDDSQLQILIFIFFLITYMLSVLGNLTIIILTLVDSHLKTAMYFFLRNFSFLEILFTSACIPRFFYSLAKSDKTISYSGCMSQLFFIDIFGIIEFFLLAVMSYDRYAAICKPLHYMTIMSHEVCKRLVFCCWLIALIILVPPVCVILGLEFCENILDHFFCDFKPLLKISCSDTWLLENMVIFCSVLIFVVTLLCVVLSYMFIMRTILRFPSAQQKMKAFSTCSSHFIVVSISYGSCIFIYIKPSMEDEMIINKGVGILVTSVSPMLNPFIYTLRNQQVKQAFNDLFKRIILLFK
ncbi:olfactory receptor 6C2-like [Erinaceus europaeus]|uniref:Olfactory receptor n=1 Tax=Erinaceus europaeus TaxID=9365 RepID=A0A1S2ZEH5_ERIEU|nr:olfactory receptor 6C2-like [Erinaceus europaeus]